MPWISGQTSLNIMLPYNIKILANYIEEAGYETDYIGKWHLASDGEVYGKEWQWIIFMK